MLYALYQYGSVRDPDFAARLRKELSGKSHGSSSFFFHLFLSVMAHTDTRVCSAPLLGLTCHHRRQRDWARRVPVFSYYAVPHGRGFETGSFSPRTDGRKLHILRSHVDTWRSFFLRAPDHEISRLWAQCTCTLPLSIPVVTALFYSGRRCCLRAFPPYSTVQDSGCMLFFLIQYRFSQREDAKMCAAPRSPRARRVSQHRHCLDRSAQTDVAKRAAKLGVPYCAVYYTV